MSDDDADAANTLAHEIAIAVSGRKIETGMVVLSVALAGWWALSGIAREADAVLIEGLPALLTKALQEVRGLPEFERAKAEFQGGTVRETQH